MKHSIALIFSMVAPNYWTSTLPIWKENTAFKKELFYFKLCTSRKIAKNMPSCGGKMAPSDTVFNKNFFRVERGFLKVLTHQNSTLFRNCKGVRFSHLSPLKFFLKFEKK